MNKMIRELLAELGEMAYRIHLPTSYANLAKRLLINVWKSEIFESIDDSVAAACLFIACNQERLPRTIGEIGAVTSATVDEIKISYITIRTRLNIKMKPETAADFLPRFGGNLGLAFPIVEAAREIATRAETIMNTNVSRTTIAAAAISMAIKNTGVDMPIEEISCVTGVPKTALCDVIRHIINITNLSNL